MAVIHLSLVSLIMYLYAPTGKFSSDPCSICVNSLNIRGGIQQQHFTKMLQTIEKMPKNQNWPMQKLNASTHEAYSMKLKMG